MLLALDTSTDLVSVALHDGSSVVGEKINAVERRHAETLTVLIDQLLSDARIEPSELTRIVVGTGPGGFTGLRVGLVTARTLALALRIPCDGIMTLDAMAVAARERGDVESDFLVALDARRREVFWARYVDGVRVDGPRADAPQTLRTQSWGGLPIVGNIAHAYPSIFDTVIDAAPSAAGMALALVAGSGEVTGPDPVYVRTPDATEPKPVVR